jgi:uncharacterized protein YdiU (UPF0061 family)
MSHHVDGTNPVLAAKTGLDESICGDCDLRGSWDQELEKMVDRICYVNLGAGEYQKYVGFNNGKYPNFSVLEDYSKKFLQEYIYLYITRFGAYGDPTSDKVAFNKLLRLVRLNNGIYTGYTRFWAKKENAYTKTALMASVVGQSDYNKANDLGWRTYRTKLESDPLLAGEALCPHPKLNCDTCGLCSGTDNKKVAKITKLAQKNIAINVHGIRPKTNAFRRLVDGKE